MNKGVLIGIGVVIAAVLAYPLLSRKDSGPPPPAPEIDIWEASARGMVEMVEQHLAAGTDIHGTFAVQGVPGTGGTPLHIACLFHQHKVMRLLIDRGADLDRKAVFPDPGLGTPLHWAAFAVNQTAVEELLDAGAKINARDLNNATPLNYILLNFETGKTYTSTNLPSDRQGIYNFMTNKGATKI
jgi:hypothetical protein